MFLKPGHHIDTYDLQSRGCSRTMATAAHIELSLATAGVYHVPDITTEASEICSQLLQENHDRYHIFFNLSRFHNHIVHHLVTIWALGATPAELQKAYDNNRGIQRLQFPVHPDIVRDMANRDQFKEFLGQEQYFHDYEVFFRNEIEAQGWEAVLNEHLFARDEHADRMLTRMFAGKREDPPSWPDVGLDHPKCQ